MLDLTHTLITFAIISQGLSLPGQQSQQASGTTVADTAWVDSANPIFTPTALLHLNQFWSSRSYRGVCLRGEVRSKEGLGEVAHVTHVFSAAFPDLCRGYKNIGAAMFRYDEAESQPKTPSACDILRPHPEWAIAARVTGIEKHKLRNPEGRVVVTAAVPVASYCAWLRKEQSEAGPPPKLD